jgi:hypothetical protein
MNGWRTIDRVTWSMSNRSYKPVQLARGVARLSGRARVRGGK